MVRVNLAIKYFIFSQRSLICYSIGNILSLEAHITRMFKGMESMKITPPITQEKA
jgi:energy-coupling factor transporter transmembrane protein EcfT